MFTESDPNKQINLFSGVAQSLPKKKQDILSSSSEWHNVFFKEITSKIDEKIFSPLYSWDQGRPNAPIRVLIGMLILKEGHGWTDEQLFDQCRFNLRVMLALGLANMKEDVPVESTYYDFKSKIADYADLSGENIIQKSFQQLTQNQIKRHKILTQHVRMDSKLIQSNICRCTRLQLVIETVRKFYTHLTEKQRRKIAKKYDREFLEELAKQTASNHSYRMTNEQKDKWLSKLGHIIKKLLNIYKADELSQYAVLKRLYEQQYEERSNDIDPKDRKQIPSNSIQSPHDVQAEYRKKGLGKDQQRVTGYVANITETCHEGQINLVTDVQLGGATTPDNEFLCTAIDNTEYISDQSVTEIWTDGGFDSIANRQQFDQPNWKGKKWHLARTKGGKITYSFEKLNDGSIRVTDLKTGLKALAQVDKKGRYRVKLPRGKSQYRYFKKDTVESYLILEKVRVKDNQNSNKRANVEATIHQVFCKLNGNKSKYRGLIAHENYVLSRSYWTNFKRILTKQLDLLKNGLNALYDYLIFKRFKSLKSELFKLKNEMLIVFNANMQLDMMSR